MAVQGFLSQGVVLLSGSRCVALLYRNNIIQHQCF